MQHYLSSPEILNHRLNKLLNNYDPELSREFKNNNVRIIIQRKLRWQDRYLLVLVSILLTLLLLATATAKADEVWGVQFSQNGEQIDAVALSTNIEIEVIGSQARVEVVQNFQNQSDQWVEADYRFPLPDNAAVDQLKVEVGGRVLVGEIQEKQLAEKNYQLAKQNGHTSSLVKQEKANQFHTQLANIGPHESISVKIGFLQPVHLVDGKFRLRLPMTFTPPYTPEQSSHIDLQATAPQIQQTAGSNSGHELMLSVNLLTNFELAELTSSYHSINVHETTHGYYIILEPDPLYGLMPQTDRDFELVWSLQTQDQPVASVLTWEDDTGLYAQLQLVPPRNEAIDERPREVIFIIDTSGSMSGIPMAQATQALDVGLGQLRPEDRFNIIRFNSEAESLFKDSQTAAGNSLKLAHDAIERLYADGGTNMLPALKLALNNPIASGYLRQIIFITDGAVGNEADIFEYLHTELADSRLFTVAIGAAPNNWFMRKAAEAGRGSFTHIGKQEEIAEHMNLLWQRISQPALEDICIDWGQHAEMYPAIIPDLYAGDTLFVTARLDSASTEVKLCGQLNGHSWEYTQPFPRKHANKDIARLWARKKIETIEDNQLLGLEFAEAREQILEVALQYQLLSRFTALIAIDPEAARTPDEVLKTSKVASLMPQSLNINLAQGALGWPLQLLLGLLSLVISGGMFWRSGVSSDD